MKTEFEKYLKLAKRKNWHVPVSNLFKEEVWVRFWKDCEAYDKDNSVGRPVVPHRSGGTN